MQLAVVVALELPVVLERLVQLELALELLELLAALALLELLAALLEPLVELHLVVEILLLTCRAALHRPTGLD